MDVRTVETFNGERLRAVKEARGLSIERLVKLSHLSNVTICNLQANRTKPYLRNMENLAKVLDVDPRYFTCEIDEMLPYPRDARPNVAEPFAPVDLDALAELVAGKVVEKCMALMTGKQIVFKVE